MEKELYLLFELLRNDGSIVVNKKLAKGVGLHQAIMYSELISKYLYFSKRGELKEGYFFNTVENMEQDTCLSDYQQRESIAKLKDLGLIDYKVKGIPPKRYFKIIVSEKVSKMLNALFSKDRALRIDSQKTKELILKKLQGNNTNLNNPNNNKIFFNPLTGEWENIRKEDRADWHTINPDCNIDVELVKMKQWILDDSRRQRGNYRSFIVNWLSKDNKRERLKAAKNDFVTPNTMVDLRKELAKDDIIKPRD